MSRQNTLSTTGKAAPNNSSLVGGIVIGVATMVLWVAVMRELGFKSTLVMGVGLIVAAATGLWTRLADL